jgi:hypothetical protein
MIKYQMTKTALIRLGVILLVGILVGIVLAALSSGS